MAGRVNGDLAVLDLNDKPEKVFRQTVYTFSTNQE